MGNKTLIRHDGSEVTVVDTEADKLLTLGYKEKTAAAYLEEGISAGYDEHYSTPGQQALTAVEGGLSGLTLGGTDLLFGSEESQERARYNPGLRMASELVGGLAPIAPGLGLLKYTPAGALAKGATKAGEVIGRGSATLRAGVTGAIEGGGVGAGMAVTEAELNGDPVTVEAVMAGIGWGTVYGGGFAGLGAGVASRFESRAARSAASSEAALAAPTRKELITGSQVERATQAAKVHSVLSDGMKAEHAALGAIEEGHYLNFQGTVSDAANELKNIRTAVAEASHIEMRPVKQMADKIREGLADAKVIPFVRADVNKFTDEFSLAQLAAKEGKYEKMVGHLEKFKEAMVKIEGEVSGQVFKADKVVASANSLIGHARMRLDASVAAAEEAVKVTAIHGELSRFPKTAAEFAGMSEARVEKLAGALDNFGGLKAAELSGLQTAVTESVANLQQGLGVKLEGTPGAQLRGVWSLLKEGQTRRVTDELNLKREGDLLWNRTSKAENKYSQARMDRTEQQAKDKAKRGSAPWGARYMVGSWAASKTNGGPAGAAAYLGGSWLVSTLMGFKGAVLGTISEKANKWLPRVGRGVQKVAPRMEPFATRLDGTMEEERATKVELMQRRAKEIQEAAPGIRDTLYKAVQPLAISNPELAAGLHAHGIKRFQFIMSKMPKDPGLAFSNLKSLWKPDAIAMEKFARYYEVFHNPVAVVTRALETGRVTIEAAEGLREMDPELFAYMRAGLLNRMADPAVQKKMKYADQVHMGILLDLPVHSTMDPRFIAPQQQMFLERNQPLEMSPRIQPGGGAGRPSGPGPSATSAQRTTEH